MGILGLQIGLQIGVVVQILGVHFSKIGLQIGEVVQIFELKRVGSAPKGHQFTPLENTHVCFSERTILKTIVLLFSGVKYRTSSFVLQ